MVKKRKDINDQIPLPDGPLKDYLTAQKKTIKQLLHKNKLIEPRMSNVETFLDGKKLYTKGLIFHKLDVNIEDLDKEE